MYLDFAHVYDRLTQDVDYERIADFLEAVFRKFDVAPELVLDLACGSGSLSMELAARGYDMIGVDASQEMLAAAMEKKMERGLDVLLLHQDMRSFELYGTVGAILCTLDGLNYLLLDAELERSFRLAWNYLDPDGLFVFDLNSHHKLSTVLPACPSYEIREDVVWLWHSEYDAKREVCAFDLVVFEEAGKGRYQRIDERHEERAWRREHVESMLAMCGFRLEAVYDGHAFAEPRAESPRLTYVARAIKNVI